MNPQGPSTILLGLPSFIVCFSPYFVINYLIYKFPVDNIEYGRGEGSTKPAASAAAATQALSQLRSEYGST